MREKAEQEKQATSQAILDEHIVDEIEQGLRACHCLDSDTDTPPMAATTPCIKSCLKKTPTKEVESCSAAAQEGTSPCKSTNSKSKNHKKEHHHHQASSSKEYASTDSKCVPMVLFPCFTELR